jgi:hypothetical protein
MICYHATDHDITKFNLDWLNYGEHNFGLGIYFSDRNDNIDFFMNENPNGNIYKVDTPDDTMVQWHSLCDKEKLYNFIHSYLSTFDILADKTEEIYNKYQNKNYLYIMCNLPWEIYKFMEEYKRMDDDYLKNYLINFVKYTGITSMFAQNGTFRNEVLILDVETIEIL